MNRFHFVILATIALCALPVLSTLQEDRQPPRKITQLQSEPIPRLY